MKRLLAAAIGACAAAGLHHRRGRIRRKLGRARLSRRLPSRFRCRSPRRAHRLCPPSSQRGRQLFKAKFTTVDGAGRPMATQAIIPTKRKNGVNPPFSRTSGPDSNSCFGCHNDPVIGGVGATTSPMSSCRRASRARSSTSIDPPSRASGTPIALMGAGLVELLAREMTADLQAIRSRGDRRRARRARTRAPIS